MLTIVGISGRLIDKSGKCVGTSRVGKDTVAKALELYHDFTVIGLSDDMTSILYRIGGRDGGLFKRIEDYRKEKQYFGTESRIRAGVPGVWRDVLKVTIAYLHDRYGVDRFVVPDVRYDEEIDALKDLADRFPGRFVHLEVIRYAPDGYTPDPHSSEQPVAHEADDGIVNFCTKRDLIEAADIVGESILGGGYDRVPTGTAPDGHGYTPEDLWPMTRSEDMIDANAQMLAIGYREDAA